MIKIIKNLNFPILRFSVNYILVSEKSENIISFFFAKTQKMSIFALPFEGKVH